MPVCDSVWANMPLIVSDLSEFGNQSSGRFVYLLLASLTESKKVDSEAAHPCLDELALERGAALLTGARRKRRR